MLTFTSACFWGTTRIRRRRLAHYAVSSKYPCARPAARAAVVVRG